MLSAAAVSGVDAEAKSLAELPLYVGVEVVALETCAQQNTVLVGVVGREGVAALVRRATDAQFMALL
jgi:hypothetical protein